MVMKLKILSLGGSSSPAGQVAELSIEGNFQDPLKIKYELKS